jgi:glutathionyl-hydroquinone reductase
LYQQPDVAETVDLDHIKRHYYVSHGSINPTGIVPKVRSCTSMSHTTASVCPARGYPSRKVILADDE